MAEGISESGPGGASVLDQYAMAIMNGF